jgi:hypothetical protein
MVPARIAAMTDGTGTRQYAYVPVGSPGALQLQQESGTAGLGHRSARKRPR